MSREDIANLPDYRQKTPLDKMISNIQNPQAKDLTIQLRDQISVMESTNMHRYTNYTPDHTIEKDSKTCNRAQKEISNIRAVLNKQAPEILSKFDDAGERIQEERAQRQQKNQLYTKQDTIQLDKLKQFKNLLDQQQRNIKKYKEVDTFWNRRYSKNKIASTKEKYVLTQVEINGRPKADQSLLLNIGEGRAKLENPPKNLQKAVEEYTQSLSRSPTSYGVKAKRKSTRTREELKLDEITRLTNEGGSDSNPSSPSLQKPNHTLGKQYSRSPSTDFNRLTGFCIRTSSFSNHQLPNLRSDLKSIADVQPSVGFLLIVSEASTFNHKLGLFIRC